MHFQVEKGFRNQYYVNVSPCLVLLNDGRIVNWQYFQDLPNNVWLELGYYKTRQDAENAIAEYVRKLPDEELAEYIADRMLRGGTGE